MYRVTTYVVEQNRYVQRGPGIDNAASPGTALVWLAGTFTGLKSLHFAECTDMEGNSQWRLSVGADT